MTDLQDAKQAWIEESPKYKDFVVYVTRSLERQLQTQGIYGIVTGRPKDLDSLLKKLITKKIKYADLSDRAGARIIVKLGKEILEVKNIIRNNYEVLKEDDKTAALAVDQFNYQGLHIDAALKCGDPAFQRFAGMQIEIQVKTKAQHLWSEFAHDLSYKTVFDLPNDIQRRFCCLAALLEMADREFEAVEDEIMGMPDAFALVVLSALERQFYKHNPVAYSKPLSVQVINSLSPLYGFNPNLFFAHFQQFRDRNAAKLDVVFSEAAGRSFFLSQPEVLMIFDLIDRDVAALGASWSEYFPFDELEQLAIAWGKPLY